MKCVGIDLGTSLSSASIIEDGKPTALRIDTAVSSLIGDSYSIPSSIFVEENGDILIGQAADNSRLRDPGRYRKEFKRDLGTKVPYQIGQKDMVPEELYKVFLKYLKQRAEERVGDKVGKIVITHPANFTAFKKDLIKQAALMAGFIEVVLIDEPTAAAIYYSSREKIEAGQKLLVYDLGGGTFDLSLIIREDEGFRPLTAPLGLERCGGVDFQNKIYRDILETFKDIIGPIVKKRDINARRLISYLEEESIKIKHHLSTAKEASELIFIPGVIEKEYKLTRERFQEMIKEEISNSCDLIKQIIKNANLKVEDIDRVLLVGGSSRIPYIEEMVRKTIDVPIYKNADPELVISLGAAIYGSIGAEEEEKDSGDEKNNGAKETPGEEDRRVDILEGNFEGLVFNKFKSECAYVLNCAVDKKCVVIGGRKGELCDFVSEPRVFLRGKSILYRGHVGNKSFLVVDGARSPLYDWVGEIEFSPDDRRYCARAEKDGKEFFIVDGLEGEPYESVWGFNFSVDCSHFFYKASVDGKQALIIDGKAEGTYDCLGDICFSKDGKTAFGAKLGDKWFVISNNTKSEAFDEIGTIKFSEEGKVSFTARLKDRWHIVSENKRTGDFEDIEYLMEDGYEAKTGGRWRYVRKGEEGRGFDWIGPCKFNGEHFAYRGNQTGKYYLTIDGRPTEAYDWVSEIYFSSDGTSNLYLALNDGKWYAAANGKHSEGYDDINSPDFSPQGNRTVFIAMLGGKAFAVVDGMRGEAFDSIGKPVFSPDGKRLAYRGKDGNKWYMVIDGMRSEGFEEILTYEFSSNSAHIMCKVKSKGKELLLIDGKVYGFFDEIYEPCFSQDGSYIKYYYRNEKEIRYRFEKVL